jgi:hypothetical protein
MQRALQQLFFAHSCPRWEHHSGKPEIAARFASALALVCPAASGYETARRMDELCSENPHQFRSNGDSAWRNDLVRILTFAVTLISIVPIPAAEPPPKASISLDDQFEHKRDVAEFRGDVVIILYGDREGTDTNKLLAERINAFLHPPISKGRISARAAPPAILPVDSKQKGPLFEVRIVPVMCVGKSTDVIKNYTRQRVRKESPDAMVLIDFENKIKEEYGLKAGETNMLLIDAAGRLRMKINGDLDPGTYKKVLRAIDILRHEAAGK